MKPPLRVLHLEANPADAALIQATLESEGVVSQVTRVDTQADFVASLAQGGFDIILADYTLPSFDGLSALGIALEKCPDVPFIFVSGTLGEDVAIEALKMGATDYLVKERLTRIVPSVHRALREAKERIERKCAEDAARAATARFQGILEIAPDAIISVNSHQRIVLFNQGAERVFGYTQAEVIGRPLDLLLPLRFGDGHREHIEDFARSPDVARTIGQRREVSGRRKDGDEFPAEANISKLELGSELVFTVILRDISERKRADEERQTHLWFLESMDQVNRAIQGTNDLEQLMSDVLDTLLSIFQCDRAWLGSPCDPEALSWRVTMEHTRPEFPGAFALGLELPVDEEIATVFQGVRASRSPLRFGPGSDHPLPAQAARRFSIQSMMGMAIYPKEDRPHMLGLHQCSHARVWTPPEERLFQEIGRRLEDALTSLLTFRTLGESERKLEEAQRIAHVGHWERDLDTDLGTWSDETYRIYGLSPAEGTLTPGQIVELIHPDDRQMVLDAVAAALQGGDRYEVEYRVVRPSGEVRIIHSQGDVTRDGSGRPRRTFGTAQDITERKRAEQRLVAQHTVTQILAEAATLEEATPRILQTVCEGLAWDLGALWRIDQEARVLRCVELWRKESLAAPNFTAASREITFPSGVGLPGRIWSSHEPAHIPDVVHDDNFLRGPIAASEGLHAAFGFPILLGGEVLGVVEFFSGEIRQSDQEMLEMMATIGSQMGQFIERKRAEEALQRAHAELAHVARVATLGELAASIAHELNQPLAAIVTSADACLRWLADEPPNLDRGREAARRIVRDGTRAGDVIARIRALVRKANVEKAPLSINDVLEEIAALAQAELRRTSVALRMHLAPDLPPVLGDRVQLQQVVLNLVVNGVEAMASMADRARELLIRSRLHEPDHVLVAVQDSGIGLDQESLEKIFDPFYTTKSQGMGMGLAISRSIIEAHGGRLWATANEGTGAVFQFTLPTGGGGPS
jgi:PAS domain S-box-containing protein